VQDDVRRPGSLSEKPSIKRFNGKLRAECLGRWIFANGYAAQIVMED